MSVLAAVGAMPVCVVTSAAASSGAVAPRRPISALPQYGDLAAVRRAEEPLELLRILSVRLRHVNRDESHQLRLDPTKVFVARAGATLVRIQLRLDII